MGKATARPRAGIAKASAAKVGAPKTGAAKTKTAKTRATVLVRPARDVDLPAVTRLRHQAERAHARLMPDYFRDSPPDAPGAWQPGQGPWSTVLLAESVHDARTVLGLVAVRVVVTPRDPAMVPRRRAHVEVIVVDEGHRGAGVGTTLMQAATAWAREREAEEMVLTVWADNAAAEALYATLGYQPIARILRRKID